MHQPHLTSCKQNACRFITTIPLWWEPAKMALVSQGARVTHLSQPPTKFVSRKAGAVSITYKRIWSNMAWGFLISVMKDGVDKASFRECWYFCCASSERANWNALPDLRARNTAHRIKAPSSSFSVPAYIFTHFLTAAPRFVRVPVMT